MKCIGLLILLLAGGCITMNEGARMSTFEFPFVEDYGIVNRTTFPWSDEYLAGDPYVYSQQLAGPLVALASSTYGYRLNMDVHSLESMDFPATLHYRRYGRDIDYSNPKYGKNQVGFTFATRRTVLDGYLYDILLVVVRGTFGRYEWISNMNACNAWGKAENPDPAAQPLLHEGFSRAADCVMEELVRYVASNRLDLARTKVLVTGHSRGAAVANIIGARLDDTAGSGAPTPFAALDRSNIFVYTFAAPNTVIAPGVDCRSPRYGNIFNVINPEDMVPRVPITRWSANRYGRDLMLKSYDYLPSTGSWTDSAYCCMKDEFKAMTGYEYWHTPMGTNSTDLVPAMLGALAPTLADLYAIPPEQRADGNMTSIHSILETVIWRSMDDPIEQEHAISLGGDVNHLSDAYSTVSDAGASTSEATGMYMPDGRDFSRQPGFFDLGWRLSCMHATQTYIGWMKAGEEYGPENIYVNWPLALRELKTEN